MTVDTEVKVRDLMRTHVTTLQADAPILSAIELLEENRISGAPVVNAKGVLSGFLSLRDIARSDHLRADRFDEELRERMLARRMEEFSGGMDEDEEESDWEESDEPTQLAADRVRDWMNPEVISISPDATLRQVCKKMAADKIHRVLVVEDGQLVGIVTSFDVVTHVARSK